MKDLNGKVAFITGGASGIGLGMAKAFLKAGVKVVIADVEKKALEEAEKDLKLLGGQVLALHLDVSDRDAMERAAEETERRFGKVHILCNNAGVLVYKALEDTTHEDWEWVIRVNLFGIVNGLQAFTKRILSHGEGGHIINTSSIAGIMSTHPKLIAYNTSKFAIVGLSETLLQILGPKGIGVSVLCPATVESKIFQAERNRPAKFSQEQKLGSPVQNVSEEFKDIRGVSADVFGEIVIEGIKNNEFYIFTHPEFKDDLVSKMQLQLRAFDIAREREEKSKP